MRLITLKNYEELSRRTASFVAQELKRKPGLVLGLATGETPKGTYQELIRLYREEGLDFSGVITFNLDEYYKIPPGHPQSYHSYMQENFLKHVNLKKGNVYIPDGVSAEINSYCQWYEQKIKEAGGIDLQILGIGRDGHIGFNEPGSSLGSRTRLKTLAEETVKDHVHFFKNKKEVPRFAITMGIGTIMEARKIILLASGGRKAEILARAIEGPITAEVPASVLQMHPAVIILADEEAAAKLKRREYYKYVERTWLPNL